MQKKEWDKLNLNPCEMNIKIDLIMKSYGKSLFLYFKMN